MSQWQPSHPIEARNMIILSPCQKMLYVKYGRNGLQRSCMKMLIDRRTTDRRMDTCLYYKPTYEPIGSGELKMTVIRPWNIDQGHKMVPQRLTPC